ncbi:Agamous-like MADS-box protein AGL80 [Glycine soja]|uniref:Agamous-like MADS-box protein AGL80 n=1 Tax=Glycine soja TaxID=3848 RepID=A0A0B2QAN7_GLYSO|nr:agamous-like MADS-box protein AGL80 [Glycine soja]KAG4923554.1 hypothetical protein JHK87_049094 [Glycine soja]KAH1153317.1 hypothetical protein GYH30_049100 [Glycine max]KHN18666.1 Agamous-like MADS-box protein AGL80 [Glycine soja]RZB50788.1 Agamous-like MADS-box protein AGL80 [Glycine soja]
MTRKKVKLAFIGNDAARRATYKKRKKGMLKKVEELSTLCGIEACAIVYGHNDPEPEVWPSHWGVQRVVEKLRTMPELEQRKKMVNQEGFIGQKILKGNEKVMKLMKDNREKEITMFLFQCLNAGRIQPDNNMTTADLNVLSSLIDQNLKDISKRLETLSVNEMTPNQPLMQTPAYQPLVEAPSYNQSHLQTPAYQPQTQTPALAVPKNEEMALLNYGHGLDMSDNSMQRLLFMDLLNSNGDETIMPPFGDANLQLQNDFWPDLGLLP